MTGNVEFIDLIVGFNPKKKFRYNPNAKLNSPQNPILMDGVRNVNKTILGKTTEILKEFSSPAITGYGLYKIFN